MSAHRPQAAPSSPPRPAEGGADAPAIHDRPPPALVSMGPGGKPGPGQGGAPSAASGGGNPRGAPPQGVYGILHVIGGNDRGKQCELSRQTTNIGRGADQDLVLADIAVSRRHIKIHLTQTGYRLQDLGSGNGTLINGKRVDEVPLVDGDQIELGNTLLRFEHPPSRADVAAPPAPAFQAPPPPAFQAPPPAFQAPPAFPPPQPFASAAAPAMPQPFASAAAPAMAPPFASAAAPALPGMGAPQPIASAGSPSFLATDKGRKIAFPAVGLMLLVGLGGLGLQLGRPAPQGPGDAAVRAFSEGTKHFAANDFDAARKSFKSALELAPDSQELRRYMEACDTEAEALGFISAGRKELEARRYGEALKAFQKVENKSVQYDYAQQQAVDARREAAKTSLTKAQELALTNPEAAKQQIQEGLEYDPENRELLELRNKVNSGNTVPVLPNQRDEVERPAPPVVKAPKPPKPAQEKVQAQAPKAPKQPVAQAPKAQKGPEKAPAAEPASPGSDLQTNKGALLAYRSRDFAGASTAMQNFAKINRGATQARAQATARDIDQVRGLIDKAGKLEAGNPAGALQAYNEAAALDRRLSGGALSAFLSPKITALQGRARGAAGAGVGAGGPRPAPAPVAAGGPADPARDAKADQLLGQARAQMARNPSGAKLLCRQAMQLYGKNTSHPKYQQAYQLLTSIKGKDDDED